MAPSFYEMGKKAMNKLEFSGADFSEWMLCGRKTIAEKAQEKFRLWLEEQRKIFGFSTANDSALDLSNASYLPEKKFTHKGFLIYIEAIQKDPCLHSSITSMIGSDYGECIYCGEKMIRLWAPRLKV